MKEKNEKKPLTKKAQILIICGCISAGVLVGGGSGLLFGYLLKAPVIDFTKVNIDDLEGEQDADADSALLRKLEECLKNNEDPTSIFKLHEIVRLATLKFSASTNSLTYGYGSAINGAADLDIRNCTIRNGNKYMEESSSKTRSGALVDINIAQRDIQDGTNDSDTVNSYRGTIVDKVDNSAFDNAKTTQYTVKEYEKRYGKKVSSPSVYIVNEKTILTVDNPQVDTSGNSTAGESKITKVDGGYKVYLELHTQYAVARYYYRMVNLSESTVSSFNYVHLIYNLDSELNIVSTEVNEEYFAGKAGVSAKVNGNLKTYFFTKDVNITIPDTNTKITYPVEGEQNA